VETIVACLDSVNGETQLRDSPESVKQVAAAEKVVITKTDIGTPEATARLRERVLSINPALRMLEAAHGRVDGDLLRPESGWTATLGPPESSCRPAHSSGVRNIAIQFAEPLDWMAFGLWMSMLLHRHGEKVLRVKGIVDVGEKGPVVLNGVQHIMHPPRHLKDWKDYETRGSQIVFIMRDIAPKSIFDSLMAFQHLIGARPEIREIDMNPLA
jgi:G3E family GTPase